MSGLNRTSSFRDAPDEGGFVIDTDTLASPGWWLNRLLTKLAERKPRYDLLDSYFRGDQAIPIHASKAVRQSYRQLMAMARTNFAELAVEAIRERTTPVGFRTGASGDEFGDAEAWRIWQANSLDADSAIVHRTCYALGDAYVIVGGVDPEIKAPLISPEDPRQVIVESDPRRRRRSLAALKLFRDDVFGVTRAYVYLPGEVWQATTTTENPDGHADWNWVSDIPIPLPAKIVPVVRFANRVDMFGCSSSEFERHLAILDRINYTILSRIEVATIQAFRQRAVKGVPDKDEDGNDVDYDDIFAADPGALWIMPQTAELWESGQVDLGPIRQAIRDDVQDFAAVTRTPLFYLTPEANNGSAEGASLAREGLVFKTEDRLVSLGEDWEQVESYAFLFAGDTQRAALPDLEIIWAPAERFTLAARADAASKAQMAGVPWRTIMSDIWQFSPQQIARMEAERATEALLSPQVPGAGVATAPVSSAPNAPAPA